MARKPRIQFPGACYHIISRGNYRKDLFTQSGSGQAFEKALMEVCERSNWNLHAYVIMRNHYHLALETPEGNLVAGMRWLQGTFGNRFNRFTGETGHVFQSRYKSLVVEPGSSLLGLVNYIHLNPVRARICSIEDLKNYKLSSFPKFFQKKPKSFLKRKDFLADSGFPDSPSGMKKYWEQLHLKEESDPEKKDDLRKRYQRGWAIAGKAYKKQLVEDFEKLAVSQKKWGGKDLEEFNEIRYEKWVREELKRQDKSEQDLALDKKSAPWKVMIARELRNKSSVTNAWLSQRLNMGHPSNVSRHVSK